MELIDKLIEEKEHMERWVEARTPQDIKREMMLDEIADCHASPEDSCNHCEMYA